MSFYERMQAASQRLLNKFKQGTVIYNQPGAAGTPTTPPGPETQHTVYAVQAPESRKKTYIDGGYIVSTDTLLAVAPFSVAPSQSGTMQINGETYQIIMIDRPTTLPDPDQLVWFIGCRK